jgi:hypothetical protein
MEPIINRERACPIYTNNLLHDKSIRCLQVFWETVTILTIKGITEIDMNLNSLKIRRNARWLLRLTALAGANIFAGGAGDLSGNVKNIASNNSANDKAWRLSA